MTDMKQYSDAELQAELDRRKVEETKPIRLETIDFQPLIEFAEDYINALAEDGRHEKIKEYAFETIMTHVYGEKVWDWINKKKG